MSKIEINQLPVPTWTWLKVNEKSIEVPERIVPVEISTETMPAEVTEGTVTDITVTARAAEDAGADGISLINTFSAMVIDIDTRRPVLGNNTGGLSGPGIRPIAVKMTCDAAKTIKIPILGMGRNYIWF